MWNIMISVISMAGKKSKKKNADFILVTSELLATNKFDKMRLDTDENEHSIEMHLPYIANVLKR